MSTKSRKRKKRRAFLREANQICAIVDDEILEALRVAAQEHPGQVYVVSKPEYVGKFPVRERP